jgi:hypothetical protein
MVHVTAYCAIVRDINEVLIKNLLFIYCYV